MRDKTKWNKILSDQIEKNQLKKALEAKQKTIKRIKTKIDTNTNSHDTFNFWKELHEIQCEDERKGGK